MYLIKKNVIVMFLGGDNRRSGRHFLIFNVEQLKLLSEGLTLYMDATFKVVKEPFYQLLSLHRFVKGPMGTKKQVPLVYALMSGKRASDYAAVSCF